VLRIHEQLFAAVPDLTVESLRSIVDGHVVWAELEWRGTRRDGSRFLMRGPFLFGFRDGVFAWLRCYIEPVDQAAIALVAPAGFGPIPCTTEDQVRLKPLPGHRLVIHQVAGGNGSQRGAH
jgi:hypothetical protein